jgi:shikimate kinase
MPAESPQGHTALADKPMEAANLAYPQRIVLTGFMGAGKSTVGRLLAQQLNWRFIDADDEIEAAAGATIAEIFRQHGEPWFRQLEHETIHRLIASEELVLALGGGAIEDQRTRSLLLTAQGTHLVHLEASLETVLKRCDGTDSLRPVLQDRSNLENRYHRRLPLYRESHLTIPVDSLLPGAVVEAILENIGRQSEF